MGATKRHCLANLLLGIAISAAFLVSMDAHAGKRKKKKRGKKEDATRVEAQTAAREHYSKGKAAYDQANYADALVEFEKAYAAKPHPVVLKSIAECKFQTGDLEGALETLEKFVADPEATDKEEVQARIDEIKNTPVKVEVTSEPTGAAIFVDGTDTGEVTPATIQLPPGEHEVVFRMDGYELLGKQETVERGKENSIKADFSAEGTPTKTPESSTLIDPFAEEGEDISEEPVEVEEDGGGPPAAFWVCAALAGVGLVSGTVFGTMALGDEEDYKDSPSQAKKDAGERDALIADISFGVAGAAAIVGTIVLITASRKGDDHTDEAASLRVIPSAGDHAVGINTIIEF